MNDINRLRLDLARRNAEVFAANPNVRAMMVTGSVAKGYADDNSDIDSMVFYDEPIMQEEFDTICAEARASGGDLYHGTPDQGFAVYHYIEGIKCDFGHGTVALAEELMGEMLEKPDLDSNRQIIMSGFMACIPLHGAEWIDEWKQKLATNYPSELPAMMVKHHLRFHPRWVLEKMGVDRNDLLFLYEALIEAAGNIIGILCGINRLYHPGKLKGAEWTIDSMKIKPPELFSRLQSLFQTEPHRAIEQLYELISEVLSLLEEQMPEIDTTRTKRVIAIQLRR